MATNNHPNELKTFHDKGLVKLRVGVLNLHYQC